MKAALVALSVAVGLSTALPSQQLVERPGGLLASSAGIVSATASTSVVAGDVNGDGNFDLVFGLTYLYPGSEQRIALGDGRGRFALASTTTFPQTQHDCRALALGDLDGDGDLDLVIACGTQQQNRVWVNDGSGTFVDGSASALPARNEDTRDVALGDLDGDGDLDLVIVNDNADERVLFNDGQGRFPTEVVLPAAQIGSARAVALFDREGDGDLDLFFGNVLHEDRIFENDGRGSFRDVTGSSFSASLLVPTRDAACADIDGDGDDDLVLADHVDGVRLLTNDGNGVLADATTDSLPRGLHGADRVLVADFDGDGDVDLAIGGRAQPTSVLRNDGGGRFAPSPESPSSESVWTADLLACDVDSDGDEDLVAATSRSFSRPDFDRVYLNRGDATFIDTVRVAMPPLRDVATGAAVADVDGDGTQDVVMLHDGSPNSLLLGDGRGRLRAAPMNALPADSDASRVARFADVDGDGDADLLVANLGLNRLYLNDGRGRFTDGTASRLPADSDDSVDLALGDVDGDGDCDIVVANRGFSPTFAEPNRLYLNDGSGTFTTSTTGLPADVDFTHGLALDDVDGDGDDDLIIGNRSVAAFGPLQPNRLYVNAGGGRFVEASPGTLPPDRDPTTDVALGDLDGDLDPDLVVANAGFPNRVFENVAGRFVDRSGTWLPLDVDRTQAVTLLDVDGDGALDVYFGNSGSRNRVFRNDGTGTFTERTADWLVRDFDHTVDVLTLDADGDHDDDLLVVNNADQLHRILINDQLQLRVVERPVAGRTWSIEVRARTDGPLGIGARRAFAILGLQAAPQPIPLPGIGTYWLDPVHTVALPAVALPAGADVARISTAVPALSRIVGTTVFVQGLVRDVATGEQRLTGFDAVEILR